MNDLRVDAALAKCDAYDKKQPRDKDGKFGEGSGTANNGLTDRQVNQFYEARHPDVKWERGEYGMGPQRVAPKKRDPNAKLSRALGKSIFGK